MLTLIEDATLFTPVPLGRANVLLADGRIAWIGPTQTAWSLPAPLKRIDGRGKWLLPGLIDPLAHVLGGGGEGGFAYRTPELSAEQALQAGVTTLVGALGTDSLTRNPAALLGKVRELAARGVSAYMYSGSYHLPVKTVTGSLEQDLLFIPEVIGVGEVAVSDHRSSQPDHQSLAALAAEARTAGLLAGKRGLSFFHIGDAQSGLQPLCRLRDETDLPKEQFCPTHCNRNPHLLNEAVEWGKRGGWIDLTTSTTPQMEASGDIAASRALAWLLAQRVPEDRITLSSDANASLPLFHDDGTLKSVEAGDIGSLWQAVVRACREEKVPFHTALQCATRNPSRMLGLAGKGEIKVGADADLLLVNPQSLQIEQVISAGQTRC